MRTSSFGVEIQSPSAIIQSEPPTCETQGLDIDNFILTFFLIFAACINDRRSMHLVINCGRLRSLCN